MERKGEVQPFRLLIEYKEGTENIRVEYQGDFCGLNSCYTVIAQQVLEYARRECSEEKVGLIRTHMLENLLKADKLAEQEVRNG